MNPTHRDIVDDGMCHSQAIGPLPRIIPPWRALRALLLFQPIEHLAGLATEEHADRDADFVTG